MKDLRWATVGYHFQWTKRVYLREKKGDFPKELFNLCSQVAYQVGKEIRPEGKLKILIFVSFS